MKNLILIFAALLMVGCASFEKKHSRAVQFFNANEKEAAEYCSTRFPSVEKYIPGDPVVIIDTTYIDVPYRIDCDSLINAKKNKDQRNVFDVIKKVPCENRTEKITDTIIQPDKAKERLLQLQFEEANKMFIEYKTIAEMHKKQAEKYKKLSALLAFIILSYVAFRIFRR